VKGLGDAASSLRRRALNGLTVPWTSGAHPSEREAIENLIQVGAFVFTACTNESCSGSLVLSISRSERAAAALTPGHAGRVSIAARDDRREQVITDLSIVGIAVPVAHGPGRQSLLKASAQHAYRRCGRVRK